MNSNADKLAASSYLNEMTILFLSQGNAFQKGRVKRKQPKGLAYNRGLTANGRNRGQIGPNREYKLGF